MAAIAARTCTPTSTNAAMGMVTLVITIITGRTTGTGMVTTMDRTVIEVRAG